MNSIPLLLLAATSALAAPPLAKFEPPTGCYIGAFIEHDVASMGDFAVFERLVGKRHAVYMTYSGYGRPFPDAWVRRVGQHGAGAHLGWEPNDGLDAVQDDAYLRGWARAAAATGVPIFLRFASEMNGNWMPYSGDPAKFIEKWRLVTRVMREEAANVAMVWCVFHSPRGTITKYYPGDEYVDWVGVNVYSLMYHNNDAKQPASHKDPREDLAYVYNLYAQHKPIQISEFAATSWCRVVNGPTVPFALDKMTAFYSSLPTRFPRVKAVHWFSLDAVGAGLADNNYSLTHDQRLADRYRSLVSTPHFLSRVIGFNGVSAPPRVTPGGEPPPAEPRPTPPTAQPPAPVAPVIPLPADEPPPPLRAEFGIAHLLPGTTITGRIGLSAYYPENWTVRYITFLANGKPFHATNRAPYQATWDPSGLDPGRYELAIRVTREAGDVVVSPPLAVEVRNPQ